MRTLTEQTNPFKFNPEEIPKVLQEAMDEFKIYPEMFDEEYKYCNSQNEMLFAMLYEAEVAWNKIWTEMLGSSMKYYLNEADGQAATDAANGKVTFFQNFKKFASSFAAGVQSFFANCWKQINDKVRANNYQNMSNVISGVNQSQIVEQAKFYTADEIAEFNKLRSDYQKLLSGYRDQLNNANDEAVITGIKNNLKETTERYQQLFQQFEQKHLNRVEGQVTVAELNAAISAMKDKKQLEQNLQASQQSSQKNSQDMIKAANDGEALARRNVNAPTGGNASPMGNAKAAESGGGVTVNQTGNVQNNVQVNIKVEMAQLFQQLSQAESKNAGEIFRFITNMDSALNNSYKQVVAKNQTTQNAQTTQNVNPAQNTAQNAQVNNPQQ